MALRLIRELGDDILRKKCREVKEVTPRIKELISDMYETMYNAPGVGLAAPQVGVLRRIVVIDVGDGPHTLINPRILESRDPEVGNEGCLSVPGKVGRVSRPTYVRAEAWDENMEHFEIEAEGLLARAICHELDHLDGVMYVDLVEGELMDADAVEDEDEEEEDEEEPAEGETPETEPAGKNEEE